MWHHAITLQPALGLCGRHVREFDNVEKYFSLHLKLRHCLRTNTKWTVLSAKILSICNDLRRKVSQFQVETDYRLYSLHWHQTLSNMACMSAWGTIQEIIAAVSGKNSELLQLWLWLWTHHKLGVNRRVESTRWLIKDNKYPSNWNSHFVNQNH